MQHATNHGANKLDALQIILVRNLPAVEKLHRAKLPLQRFLHAIRGGRINQKAEHILIQTIKKAQNPNVPKLPGLGHVPLLHQHLGLEWPLLDLP
jgi:hypothetical protein